MKNLKFSIDTKKVITLMELKDLMSGNICNGLSDLKQNEKLFSSDLDGNVVYTASFFTNEKGLNIYIQTPKLGYKENNVKTVCYGNPVKLGTIKFD